MPAPKQLVGQKAPAFTLTNYDGTEFSYKPGTSGRPTALFFYPASGTYGCTKEACQFRDALSEEEAFKSSNVEVIGISPDSVEKQKGFVEKQNLNYPVLSDSKGEAKKAYNVSKGLMGLTASSRVTFVIDADGTVKDAFESTMNFNAHHKFVQKWLQSYTPAASATTVDSPTKTDTAEATAPAPATAEPTPGDAPASSSEPAAPEPAAKPTSEDAHVPATDVKAESEPTQVTDDTAPAPPMMDATATVPVVPAPTSATQTGVVA